MASIGLETQDSDGQMAGDLIDQHWSVCRANLAVFDGVSASSITERIQATRRMLEAELGAMQHVMCLVRNRQNDLAPISMLPAEVLVNIFLRLPQSSESLGRSSEMRWIRAVSHVCHRWRELALQSASLWININPSLGVQWVSEMLSRSRSAPLRVTLDGSLLLGYLDAVRDNMFRTRHLQLNIMSHKSKDILYLFTMPAPMLEIIHIIGPFRDQDAHFPHRTLFSEITPKLRRVAIRNCVFSVTIPLFSGLAHLDIEIAYRHPGEEILPLGDSRETMLNRFFDCLELMPGLEFLRLIDCFGVDSTTTNLMNGRPTFQPPNLHTLIISDIQPSCIAILDHIEARNLLDLSVAWKTIVWGLNEEFDPHLLAIIAARVLTMHKRTPFQYFELHSSDCALLVTSTNGRRYGVRLQCRKFEIDCIQDICRVLPLDEITELRIEVVRQDPWPPETWLEVFGRCKQVRNLHLETPEAETICKALVPKAHADDTNKRSPLFRNLVTLRLDGPLERKVGRWIHNASSLGTVLKIHYRWLPHFLRKRKEAGMPIRTLLVSDTSLFGLPEDAWIARLQETVEGECIINRSIWGRRESSWDPSLH
ncbi:hypothetical protein EVG20_g3416 [Dentipellis fragilis]|uniref:F-box domain-containing protein n=1 Tax=Dentipellis fragilis TaxID=205917 RepID=A0A4Y9Z4L2_9AGAM|nr:hypothetical protein EVG20_g3416 [Dentipellis fragilis]